MPIWTKTVAFLKTPDKPMGVSVELKDTSSGAQTGNMVRARLP
jgi:hypothetical protein